MKDNMGYISYRYTTVLMFDHYINIVPFKKLIGSEDGLEANSIQVPQKVELLLCNMAAVQNKVC